MVNKKPRYTTIDHDLREQHGLNLLEYCVIDGIHKLSHKPDFPWCTNSKSNIARWYGCSERQIRRIIADNIDRGYLERNSNNYIRTTHKWIDCFEIEDDSAKMALGVSKGSRDSDKMSDGLGQNVREGSDKMSANSNNNDNNNNSETITAKSPSIKNYKEHMFTDRKQGTWTPSGIVKREAGLSSIGDVLKKYKVQEDQPTTRVVKKGGAIYPWQDHAARVAEKLGFKGDKQWFKLFRDAYSKKQVGLLDRAYSAMADVGARDPQKYFYWQFNKMKNETNTRNQ